MSEYEFINLNPHCKSIVMSFHPKYADAILSGNKTVEIRRVFLSQKVKYVYIYATKPVGQIVGRFTVEKVLSYEPCQYELLWDREHKWMNLTIMEFRNYVKSANRIKTIDILDPIRCKPFPIERFLGADRNPIRTAPQNYRYVTGHKG